MGPTIDTKIELMPVEISAEVVIDTSDSDTNLASSPSSSDGDLSSSDDLFISFYSKSRSKENRPVFFDTDDIGGRYEFKVGGHCELKVTSSGGGGDESYQRRRQRNNAAVKRSRDKARQRQRESQRHLAELTAENRRLQLKADVLLKELSLLRGLFPAVGATAPRMLLEDVDAMLADSQ
jgi:hypothetical protein